MNLLHFFHNALHLKPNQLHTLDKMLGEPAGTLEAIVNTITAPVALVAGVAATDALSSLQAHNPEIAALIPVSLSDTAARAETPTAGSGGFALTAFSNSGS